jgi:hypothetical protein
LSLVVLYSPDIQSFRRKKDMRMYEISFQVGVGKDEIIISSPIITQDGSHVVDCHCDQRAVTLSFKKDGSMESLCQKHYDEANSFEPVKSLAHA